VQLVVQLWLLEQTTAVEQTVVQELVQPWLRWNRPPKQADEQLECELYVEQAVEQTEHVVVQP